MKQKHDESLKDFVTRFFKVRNEITEIEDIEVILAFKDTVRDVKTVEMLAQKKPKTMAELLSVTEQCVEMAEARSRLEPPKKNSKRDKTDDREVATAGRERSEEDRRERDHDDRRRSDGRRRDDDGRRRDDRGRDGRGGRRRNARNNDDGARKWTRVFQRPPDAKR